MYGTVLQESFIFAERLPSKPMHLQNINRKTQSNLR